MSKMQKARNWAMVVYPESAPEDWREQLQLTGLRCAISPLHNRDINADEADKKPHWHVIAVWDGPTTYNVAKSIADMLSAPAPQALNSVRGYYRYLTHLDNPDKYQYDAAEIEHLGGFDIGDYVEMTKSEMDKAKRDILGFIRDADLYEYADLLDILADNERWEWLTVAMGNTLLYRGYLASRANRRDRERPTSEPPQSSDFDDDDILIV